MLLCLTGCDMPAPTGEVRQSRVSQKQAEGTRFIVESYSCFQAAGYQREILVITDTRTGKEYLVIAGCGVEEMPKE